VALDGEADVSRDDVRRIAAAGQAAAERSFAGKDYGVIVIVAEVGPIGSPITMATNIRSDVRHILELLKTCTEKLAGGGQ
jgi:hypothetical protein